MSTLNLALQHVALARKLMDPDCEDMLKDKNTFAEVHKVLQEENPGLCDQFQAIKITEGIGFAETTDDINNTLNFVQFLEPSNNSKKCMASEVIY